MRRMMAWLDTRKLVTLLVFWGVFAITLRPLVDADQWWHLAAGDWMRSAGQIAVNDPFSHTVAGRAWIEHGWLPDILASWVFEHLGYAGLGLLLGLTVTGALALVYRQMEGRLFVRAFTLLLVAVASAIAWTMRPQIFSYLYFAGVLWMLDRYRRGRRRAVWLLLPLMLLWTNTHGGWINAYLPIGCYLLGGALNRLFWSVDGAWRPLWALAGVAALSLPLVVLNPHGATMLAYPFQTLGMGATETLIQEWASPDFHQLQMQPFAWMLLLTVAAIGIAGRRVDFTHLVTLCLFGYAALISARMIPLFAMATAPILSRYGDAALTRLGEGLTARYPRLASLSGDPAPPRPILLAANWLILLLVMLAAATLAAQSWSVAANEAAQAEIYPAGAVAYLQTYDLPGEMFNSYNWGGYLIWKLYPAQQVYIDGRADLYGDEFIEEYLRVTYLLPGWEETLARYDVGHVVMEAQSPLAGGLALHAGWREMYRDGVAVVFVKE
jgi:hypothetical protein